jgi:CheY-like chemotaxis protein
MKTIDPLKEQYFFGNRIRRFQNLMKIKVREILLVSSMYDYYLFEEDGRLYELMREEYRALNLSFSPEITHVTTGLEAEEVLFEKKNTIDLIIATLHIEDMHVVKFAQKVKKINESTPIILLAYDNRELKELQTYYDTSSFDKIFIWQGDYRLLIAIIKYIEDKLNIENDTKAAGVQTILLIEDNIKFYSSYLPIIYTEIFQQSQRLISEGVNLTHKYLRMRARPKIYLCTDYDEAMSFFEQYQDYILGIVLDVNFKRGGIKDREAGIQFAQQVRNYQYDIPILLQSSNVEFAKRAKEINASFIQKGSPMLLQQLRDFIQANLGFGDFIFKTPDGTEVGRAHNLITLEEQIHKVSDESIVYHAERNHFSNWLKARTEFWLAHHLRPRKVSDFETVLDLRQEIINSINAYQELQQRGAVTDFKKESFNPENSFARIGSGSLGGKARGLGFLNNLINNYGIRDQFDDVIIYVPSGIVIATDIFDQFLSENNLLKFALNSTNDKEIAHRFINAKKFPEEAAYSLKEYLEIVTTPLAVRSSSLLEDSQFQPLAGVYHTYMIPNSNPDMNIRLKDLLDSVKMVYASTFFQNAKNYMKATSYRLEEEKMAVIVQLLVGANRNNRFYPDFAGVAKSYNFYPVPPQTSTDGIALVALGLGRMVVEGGNSVRFCPKYPKHLLQFFSTKETIRNAQQYFYALNLDKEIDINPHMPDDFVQKFDLSKAEEDQTLFLVGSTYSPENEAVYDGVSRDGKRVVTFAPILKHNAFQLADILNLLLEIGTWGMGTPIEIEFAANTKVEQGSQKEFAVLQIRPFVVSHEMEELVIEITNEEDLLCHSTQVLGNGVYNNLYDIVLVDIEKFDRAKSNEVANEVSYFNSKLLKEQRPYLLIGVGRWGSLDTWLGIPVTWDQIAGATVIVESGFKDLHVTPSQGSHFFQNITSFRIGYFTVNSFEHIGFIDWDWLNQNASYDELKFTKHLKFDQPLTVKINGRRNKGIILKPGK